MDLNNAFEQRDFIFTSPAHGLNVQNVFISIDPVVIQVIIMVYSNQSSMNNLV